MGPLSDIHGRRPPLLISMVLFTLASVGCAFAPSIEWFIALRFIQGVVSGRLWGMLLSMAYCSQAYLPMSRALHLFIS